MTCGMIRPAFRWTGTTVEPVPWRFMREELHEEIGPVAPIGMTQWTIVRRTLYIGHPLKWPEALLYLPEGATVTDEHLQAVARAMNL